MIRIPGGILCCGNVVQDLVVRAVDQVHFDTTTWVESIVPSIGGNGANTCYAAATLDAKVRLASVTGDDDAGRSVAAQLAEAGVDISELRAVSGEATARTVVLVNSAGARAFLHHPGVNRLAFREPLHMETAGRGCSHFHLANPFTGVELRRQAAGMLAAARSAGLTTSMDTGWDARGEWMDVIAPCLKGLDVLFANEGEAGRLTGRGDAVTAARAFLHQGVRTVVVKLGPRGCIVAGETQHCVPAFGVEVVDTTGAGDCFVGGFLAGLQRGMSCLDAARLANGAGALSVSKLGAVAGLMPLRATLEWMERNRTSMPVPPANN